MSVWAKFWQGLRKLLKAYGILPEDQSVVPSIPTNLRVDQSVAGLIRILWDEGASLATVLNYQVYRDGTPVGTVVNQIYQDSNVTPNQTYVYQVQAISDTGAASALSDTLSVSTTVNTAPAWDASQSNQALTEGVAFDLNLLSICDDADGQTIVFTLKSGGLPSGVQFYPAIDHVSGTPDYTSQGTYTAVFTADDQHGGVIDQTFTFQVTNVDITAPTVPSGLSAATVTQSTASFSWAPSSDSETGVARYNVYRKIGTGSSSLRGTTTDTSYLDTGLNPSTAYSYKVSAVDGNGNESAASAAIAATTLAASDTIPPTVPTGLAAGTATTSTIPLSWSPSSDGQTGVGGYKVYFSNNGGVSFSFLGSTSSTSFTAVSLASNTSYRFYVTAYDNASPANESAPSTTVTKSTLAGTAAIKWHPGIYLMSSDVMYQGTPGYVDSYITASGPNVKGWLQIVAWSTFEQNVAGQYDFSQIRTLLGVCKAAGKRLALLIMDRSYSGTGNVRLPNYLSTLSGGLGGWYNKPNGGIIAKIWLPAVMARLKALDAALGAEFDADPFFEGIVTEESDTGFTVGPSDYSATAYMQQVQDRIANCSTAFPHTNFWQKANFIPTNQGAMPNFVRFIRDNRAGLGNSDIKAGATNGPTNFSWAQHAVKGYTWNGSTWVLTDVDISAQLAMASDIESPDMGGKTGHPSAAQLYDQALNYEKHNHVFWERKMFVSGTGQQLYYDNTGISTSSDPAGGRWTPDIKTFLNTPRPLITTPPSNYAAVNTA